MGKRTAAQEAQQRAVEKATKARVPKDELRVLRDGKDDLVFEGDFDAQITPTGIVCVVEMVPDLLNQNQGAAIPVIRRFINTSKWDEVLVK